MLAVERFLIDDFEVSGGVGSTSFTFLIFDVSSSVRVVIFDEPFVTVWCAVEHNSTTAKDLSIFCSLPTEEDLDTSDTGALGLD